METNDKPKDKKNCKNGGKTREKWELSMRDVVKFLIWLLFQVIDFAIWDGFGFVKKTAPKTKTTMQTARKTEKAPIILRFKLNKI